MSKKHKPGILDGVEIGHKIRIINPHLHIPKVDTVVVDYATKNIVGCGYRTFRRSDEFPPNHGKCRVYDAWACYARKAPGRKPKPRP